MTAPKFLKENNDFWKYSMKVERILRALLFAATCVLVLRVLILAFTTYGNGSSLYDNDTILNDYLFYRTFFYYGLVLYWLIGAVVSLRAYVHKKYDDILRIVLYAIVLLLFMMFSYLISDVIFILMRSLGIS